MVKEIGVAEFTSYATRTADFTQLVPREKIYRDTNGNLAITRYTSGEHKNGIFYPAILSTEVFKPVKTTNGQGHEKTCTLTEQQWATLEAQLKQDPRVVTHKPVGTGNEEYRFFYTQNVNAISKACPAR